MTEEVTFVTKKLNNGLEITIRKTDPYGMWRIGYDSLGRNKKLAAQYCSGEFTSLEKAEVAIRSFLARDKLEVVGE